MRLTSKIFLVATLSFLAGCQNSSFSPATADRQQITQVSILSALMLGQYDGVMTIEELLRYGDFGVGTYDHLDGELIVLDGKAYKAKSDGTIIEVSSTATTPFAVVTRLDKTGQVNCANLNKLEELEAHLDSTLTDANCFYAVRVDGDFESITFRSVARQEPPYPPLVEVAKTQSVWTHENLKGTLVAIRSPKWVGGLSVPGYHWHFLSTDHKQGGHVLDCKLQSGTAVYDPCESWLIKLDESSRWKDSDVGKDLTKEIEQVERIRGSKP